jgi:hypothetical protein
MNGYSRSFTHINTKSDYVNRTLRQKKCYQRLLGFNDVHAAFIGRPLYNYFVGGTQLYPC